MPARTATPAQVDVTTLTEAPTLTNDPQVEILASLLADLAIEAKGAEPKVFSSDNTGVYVSRNLKAPDARALGVFVPVGGKVKLTIQAVVIDPANSKDA